MSLTIYGIPTCETCRKARRWLAARGVPHEWVDLRQDPPAAERVRRWVAALSAPALRNTSGGSYRALGPERDAWGEEEWASAYAEDPMLLKRPIIERDGVAIWAGFREAEAESMLLGRAEGRPAGAEDAG